MKKVFPPVNVFLNLEREEAARYLLLYLKATASTNGLYNRYNTTSSSNQELIDYAGEKRVEVARKISNAWMWLLSEGFLAPSPDETGTDWCEITERGQLIQKFEDFEKFAHIKLIPENILDPKLAEKVWPIFIRGDFDTAVFAAFKELEVRIRHAAKLPNEIIGTVLARKAFDSEAGPLADLEVTDKAEREAHAHLFAGAIGAFKNPSSHRDVDYDNPEVAASLIMLANMLIKIVDRRVRAKEERLPRTEP